MKHKQLFNLQVNKVHPSKLLTKYGKNVLYTSKIFFFFAGVVDTADKHSFVNISANFRKNLKRFYWDTIGIHWSMKKTWSWKSRVRLPFLMGSLKTKINIKIRENLKSVLSMFMIKREGCVGEGGGIGLGPVWKCIILSKHAHNDRILLLAGSPCKQEAQKERKYADYEDKFATFMIGGVFTSTMDYNKLKQNFNV